MRRRGIQYAVSLLIAVAAVAAPVAAQETPDDDVLLIADEIVHDKDTDVVNAVGAVELTRGGRIVRADRLSYDRASDVVTASGDVALIEANGQVVFAEHVELADDLKSGVIRAVGVLFTDQSRLAAAGGRMSADGRTELANVVYSPCSLCKEDPERSPLWRIKAPRVVHDSGDKTLTYYHSTFDAFGIPVFYLPYVRQPDPSVRRRTGFLTPGFGQSSTFGFVWSQPFFIDLTPHSDATLTPIYTSRGVPVLGAEYRQKKQTGSLLFRGSVTREDLLPTDSPLHRRLRGHVDLMGDFEPGTFLGAKWRYGFAIARATDSTYLARYNFGTGSFLANENVSAPGQGGIGRQTVFIARSQPFLTQNLYLHGRDDRRNLEVDAYHFQSLDPRAEGDLTPFVVPLVDFGYRGDPGFAGGVWVARANARVLTRERGSGNRRLATMAGWRVPFSTAIGDRYMFSASLRADAYHVGGGADLQGAAGERRKGLVGRAAPQVALDWRWPWVRAWDSWRLLAEPLAKAILAPNGGNPDLIENDDSLAFEFDEINLFADNRFPGLDRIEGGARAGYALRLGVLAADGSSSELLVGQAYRPRDDHTFDVGTGLASRFSDFVGRLSFRPANYLDLTTRFRLDREEFALRRLSLNLDAGPKWLRSRLSYIGLSNAAPSAERSGDIEQLKGSAAWRFGDYWELNAHHAHDVSDDDTPLSTGAGLRYEDECLLAEIGLTRNYTRQRDVDDTTTITFQIRLRNID